MNLNHEETEMAMQILHAGKRKPVVTSLDWTQPSAPKPHLTLQATADEAAEAAMVRLILNAGKVQEPVASTAVSQPNAALKPPATLTAEEQELVNLILNAGKVQPKPPTPAKHNPVPAAAPARAQRYVFVPAAPMQAPLRPVSTARTMTPTEVAVRDQTARAVHKYRLWEIDRIERGIA